MCRNNHSGPVPRWQKHKERVIETTSTKKIKVSHVAARVRAFARLCGSHVRNRPVAKAAQNRAGRQAIAITIVEVKHCQVACWRSMVPPGVPTLVLASLLGAGELLAAPRTCILRLVAIVIFST